LLDSPLYIIGYSGHAYVCLDIALALEYELAGYFENEEKCKNPYALKYCGSEHGVKANEILQCVAFFIGIGDGKIRSSISKALSERVDKHSINLLHPKAWVSPHAQLAKHGILISAGAVVNASSQLSEGCIINSNATVEHECSIGAYAHVAPGATLCGKVTIGDFTHVGANAVIRENVNVGAHVRIGAGAVVVADIQQPGTYVGVPARRSE